MAYPLSNYFQPPSTTFADFYSINVYFLDLELLTLLKL